MGATLARLRERIDVRLGEMRPQEDERGEVQLAALDAIEQAREPAHEPRRGDPAVRGALAHPEPTHAEVEHRRARGLEVETALLDLDEVHEEPRRQAIRLEADLGEARDELVVGEMGELPRNAERVGSSAMTRRDLR